jgi:hypothetical protein
MAPRISGNGRHSEPGCYPIRMAQEVGNPASSHQVMSAMSYHIGSLEERGYTAEEWPMTVYALLSDQNRYALRFLTYESFKVFPLQIHVPSQQHFLYS